MDRNVENTNPLKNPNLNPNQNIQKIFDEPRERIIVVVTRGGVVTIVVTRGGVVTREDQGAQHEQSQV